MATSRARRRAILLTASVGALVAVASFAVPLFALPLSATPLARPIEPDLAVPSRLIQETLTAAPTIDGIGPMLGSLLSNLDPARAVGLAAAGGLAVVTFLTLLYHRRMRRRSSARERGLEDALEAARARADRAEAFLAVEPHIVVTWADRGGEPTIEGETSLAVGDAPAHRVLAFGSWLGAADAQAIETALDRLKTSGESLRMTVRAHNGVYLGAEGQVVAGSAVLRLRAVSGDREELARAGERLLVVEGEIAALRTMLDGIPHPVWMRDINGRLVWANAAYAASVEAPDGRAAADRGLEILERPAREDAARACAGGRTYVGRVPAVIAGDRRTLDVIEVPGPTGSAGLATDVSEIAALKADLDRQAAAHARTLDQIPTGVAIFDAAQRLVFHNEAYRKLWSLDSAFLDAMPSDGEVLDRLRSERKLPEQADFRQWKAGLLKAYRAVEAPDPHWWYLPSGRTLRVVTNPNPQGGVTYLFDDVSEQFQLESRYNGLMRVQGETLDTLREGVAVFGTDGRLRLANPAFRQLWHLSREAVGEQPHIDEILTKGRGKSHGNLAGPDDEHWADIRAAVVGALDERRAFTCRLERSGGTVIDCAVAPLPDGATLLTFTDITASATIERALTEKNEALLKASQLRDDFVHHVSYELRSPLTTIIGFVELLGGGTVGPLNTRQRDYADHIMRASTALMAIINDILDLASIDNGSLALDRESVDIRATIDAAARGLEDRLAESKILLKVDVPADVGSFEADGKRVRQILFNLLSNAVGFSHPNQSVRLSVRKSDGNVVFEVADEGRGIPLEVIEKVFDRFESHTLGSRHRGVGLGLSIVRSFVELHGGRVEIRSATGEGTRVTCIFPLNPTISEAAE